MASDYLSRRDNDDFGEQIYSKAVRAGKRTYFFDVKATRGDDYFLTITESRKRLDRDGEATFTRHQMHLYKEDFHKFLEGLSDAIDYVKRARPDYFNVQATTSIDEEFDSL